MPHTAQYQMQCESSELLTASSNCKPAACLVLVLGGIVVYSCQSDYRRIRRRDSQPGHEANHCLGLCGSSMY
eukprot:scaffold29181_cov19-Prasinocladus_malaysianus.AAC.1